MGRFVTSPVQTQGLTFKNKQTFSCSGLYNWTTPSGVGCVRVVTVGGGGVPIGKELGLIASGHDGTNYINECCASLLVHVEALCCCPVLEKKVCCISANCCIIEAKLCAGFGTNDSGDFHPGGGTGRCYDAMFNDFRFKSTSPNCSNACMAFLWSNCTYCCSLFATNPGNCQAGCTESLVMCNFLNTARVQFNYYSGAGGGYADGSFSVTPGNTYQICVGSCGNTSSFGNCISATGGTSTSAVLQNPCVKVYIDGLVHPGHYHATFQNVSCCCNAFACTRCNGSSGCSYTSSKFYWSANNCCPTCMFCTCTGVGCCTLLICSLFGYCWCASHIAMCTCDGYAGSGPGTTIGFIQFTTNGDSLGSPGCGYGGSINNVGGASIKQLLYSTPIQSYWLRGCFCCTLHVSNTIAKCHNYYMYCISTICVCHNPGGCAPTDIGFSSVNCVPNFSLENCLRCGSCFGCDILLAYNCPGRTYPGTYLVSGYVNSVAGASAGSYYDTGIGGRIKPDYLLCACTEWTICTVNSCCSIWPYSYNCNGIVLCICNCQTGCICRGFHLQYTIIPGGTGIGGLGAPGLGGSSITGSSSVSPTCVNNFGCYSGYSTVGDTIHFASQKVNTSGSWIYCISPRSSETSRWFFPEDIKGLGARVFCPDCAFPIYCEDAGPGAGGLNGPSGVLAGGSPCGTPGSGGGAGLLNGANRTGSPGIVIVYY